MKPSRKGARIPAAFAWTGTVPLFRKAGFRPVGDRSAGKLRVRKMLFRRERGGR
ncbi:MAG: hypothetical protein HYY16_04875 [Planctomycetes bacterium]|nr:hypothetical protein [Planctomycetota bacterium]